MDIINTPLDQLFARLKQSTEHKAKAKAQAKPKAKPKPQAPVDTRPLIVRTAWTPEAVVLIIREIECGCCGSHFVAPNDRLLLRQHNRLVGTYCKPLEPWERYPDLPHVTEYTRSRVRSCQHCYGIEYLITDVLLAPRQMELFS